MVLYIIDHPYHYEAENLCRVFYPFDKVTVQHEFMPSDENRTVYTLSLIHISEPTRP